MNNNKNNIVIVNAHWNNRGDEAALLAVVGGIKEKFQNSNITILFKDGKSVEQFPQIEDVNYFAAKFNSKIWQLWLTVLTRGLFVKNKALKKTVKTIKKSDMIVYSPGGSVINKRFWWKKQMEYLLPFLCAKLYRVQMVVAAPSIGPFDTDKSNRITKWLLKTPKVLCVREEISRQYLSEIGITENVVVTIDSAFYDDVDRNENQSKLEEYTELNSFLKQHNNIVGITITDFKWHVTYSKDTELSNRICDSFTKFIQYLSDNGYGVLFIPQLFGNQNDSDYMNSFSNENTFTLSDTMDTYFQQFIISKLFAVVGMRYHSNIFSAKMGTPFIAIVYEEKMQGFINIAGMNEYSIPLPKLSEDILFRKFEHLIIDYPILKEKLEMQSKEWQQRAIKTMYLITNFEKSNF